MQTAPSSLTAAEASGILAATVVALIALWLLTWLALGGKWRLGRFGIERVRELGVLDPLRAVRAQLSKSFPRSWAFIAARFTPGRPTGLLLTLIGGAALYLGLLFAGLIEDVLEADEIVATDRYITDLIAPGRHPILVHVFRWITELGSMPTLTAVAIVATGFLWAHRQIHYIASVWLTIAGSQITTWSGKFLLQRQRPDFILDVTAASPSFPSGHATGATAVLGIIAYVIARDLARPRASFDIAFWTLVLILLIAFSRIFLAVHYPSDVFAGLLVGGFWLLAGIALGEVLRTTGRA